MKGKNIAVIVAAGSGKRMKSSVNKVFLEISGKSIVHRTLKIFEGCNEIDEIIIVAKKEEFAKIESLKKDFPKVKKVVEGGKERQDSVYHGFKSIKGNDKDVIVVHNASNPFVKESEIAKCISAAKKHGAAVCAFPLKETIKKISGGFVESTIPRDGVFQMQTPQCIRYDILKKSFDNAKKKGLLATDDVALVEAVGNKVKIVECSYKNIKITTSDDLEIARGIVGKNFVVGLGQDSHSFSKNKVKKLVLGGLEIDHAGFDANSDGDVILHALFNAISTAIGGRSLGVTADLMCKRGVTDSREYIKAIVNEARSQGFEINNVSIMLEAGKPKLEPYSDRIKDSLCGVLKIKKERIGIAFTSGESLTSFGSGLGMQCFATVSLER